MSSKILAFQDNLKTHLAAGGSLLGEIEARHIIILTGSDPQQEKAIDEHVKHVAARTKGIAIIVFVDEAENITEDDNGALVLDISVEIQLTVHPAKWGKKYDSEKREGMLILEELMQHVHNAEVEPIVQRHYDRIRCGGFEPLADDTFWAWSIPITKRIVLSDGS